MLNIRLKNDPGHVFTTACYTDTPFQIAVKEQTVVEVYQDDVPERWRVPVSSPILARWFIVKTDANLVRKPTVVIEG